MTALAKKLSFLSRVYLCKSFRVKTEKCPLFVLKERCEEKNFFHGVYGVLMKVARLSLR